MDQENFRWHSISVSLFTCSTRTTWTINLRNTWLIDREIGRPLFLLVKSNTIVCPRLSVSRRSD